MGNLQERLKGLLEAQGFDLLAAFTVQAYNDGRKPGVPNLPTFGRNDTLAFVIGNTKALWPSFLRHLAKHPEALDLEAPLDVYTQEHIGAIIMEECSKRGLASELRWGFKLPTEEGFVDLLRAAQLSGLAFLDEDIHMCTHPEYGPWIAFRAVVVMDAGAWRARLDAPLASNPFPELRPQILGKLSEMRGAGAMDEWSAHWRDWAHLRTLAGAAAKEHAYDEQQIEYHYTGSRAALLSAIRDFLA
jgi:methylmalonic aciduria homocystinuria type C protein